MAGQERRLVQLEEICENLLSSDVGIRTSAECLLQQFRNIPLTEKLPWFALEHSTSFHATYESCKAIQYGIIHAKQWDKSLYGKVEGELFRILFTRALCSPLPSNTCNAILSCISVGIKKLWPQLQEKERSQLIQHSFMEQHAFLPYLQSSSGTNHEKRKRNLMNHITFNLLRNVIIEFSANENSSYFNASLQNHWECQNSFHMEGNLLMILQYSTQYLANAQTGSCDVESLRQCILLIVEIAQWNFTNSITNQSSGSNSFEAPVSWLPVLEHLVSLLFCILKTDNELLSVPSFEALVRFSQISTSTTERTSSFLTQLLSSLTDLLQWGQKVASTAFLVKGVLENFRVSLILRSEAFPSFLHAFFTLTHAYLTQFQTTSDFLEPCFASWMILLFSDLGKYQQSVQSTLAPQLFTSLLLFQFHRISCDLLDVEDLDNEELEIIQSISFLGRIQALKTAADLVTYLSQRIHAIEEQQNNSEQRGKLLDQITYLVMVSMNFLTDVGEEEIPFGFLAFLDGDHPVVILSQCIFILMESLTKWGNEKKVPMEKYKTAFLNLFSFFARWSSVYLLCDKKRDEEISPLSALLQQYGEAGRGTECLAWLLHFLLSQFLLFQSIHTISESIVHVLIILVKPRFQTITNRNEKMIKLTETLTMTTDTFSATQLPPLGHCSPKTIRGLSRCVAEISFRKIIESVGKQVQFFLLRNDRNDPLVCYYSQKYRGIVNSSYGHHAFCLLPLLFKMLQAHAPSFLPFLHVSKCTQKLTSAHFDQLTEKWQEQLLSYCGDLSLFLRDHSSSWKEENMVDGLLVVTALLGEFLERISFFSPSLRSMVQQILSLQFPMTKEYFSYPEVSTAFFRNIKMICVQPSFATLLSPPLFTSTIDFLKFSIQLHNESTLYMSLEGWKQLIQFLLLNPTHEGWKMQLQHQPLLLSNILHFFTHMALSENIPGVHCQNLVADCFLFLLLLIPQQVPSTISSLVQNHENGNAVASILLGLQKKENKKTFPSHNEILHFRSRFHSALTSCKLLMLKK